MVVLLLCLAVFTSMTLWPFASAVDPVECPSENGFLPIYFSHPDDCNKFFQCSLGRAYEFKCPFGLHFNTKLNVCDWPRNANCKLGDSTSTKAQSTSSTTFGKTTREPSTSPTTSTSTIIKSTSSGMLTEVTEPTDHSTDEPTQLSTVVILSTESVTEQDETDAPTEPSTSKKPATDVETDEPNESPAPTDHPATNQETHEPNGPSVPTDHPPTDQETHEPNEPSVPTDQGTDEPNEPSVPTDHPATDQGTDDRNESSVPTDHSPTDQGTDEPKEPSVPTDHSPTDKKTDEPLSPTDQETEAPHDTTTSETDEPNDTTITDINSSCSPANQDIPQYLPHPYICGKFYQCSWGKAYLFSCPPGLHFNIRLNVCDWPQNAGCSLDGEDVDDTPEGVPSSDCFCPPGVEPTTTGHPTKCSSFCQCRAGVGKTFACGNGFHFNSEISACDWPFRANCKIETKKKRGIFGM